MTLSISMIVGEGTPNWDALFAKVMVSKVDMFPSTDSAKNAVDMFPSIDSPKNPVDMFPRTDISK